MKNFFIFLLLLSPIIFGAGFYFYIFRQEDKTRIVFINNTGVDRKELLKRSRDLLALAPDIRIYYLNSPISNQISYRFNTSSVESSGFNYSKSNKTLHVIVDEEAFQGNDADLYILRALQGIEAYKGNPDYAEVGQKLYFQLFNK